MPRPEKKPKPSWKRLLAGHLPLETETTVFILLSAFDVFMTWWLLNHGNFFESNPVARFFLHHWGMKGMIGFKFAMVAFVCVIAQVVAVKNEPLARRLLILATLIVGGVVIYSGLLYVRHAA